MPAEYVYKGVWPKWDGHPWVWTLTVTNLEAVIIMGLFTTLLAVTQSRTWVIVRYLFLRVTRPNRLPGDLEVLSQRTALKITWNFFRKLFRRSRHHQQDSQHWEYELPAYIGLWAILNGLCFIMAGVMLPWLLTDGALGAPEVRSRRTQSCQDSWLKGFPGEFVNSNLMLSSSIWEQCHDKNNVDSYCDLNFVGMNTYVTSLKSGCIFPSGTCLKDQPVATFTRANVTAHDLGLNSKLKMTVSHRIVCSPMSLNPFIRKSILPPNSDPEYGNFTMSIQDPLYNVSDPLNLQLNMWTDNGPDSGLEMFRRKSRFFVQILPSWDSNVTLETPNHIHPILKYSDAQTFVIVLKAGGILYPSLSPITDPLFAATHKSGQQYIPDREMTGKPGQYIPDREMTGIACMEQTQVCIDIPSGPKCYPWGKNLQSYDRTIMRDLRQFNDVDTVIEYATIFWKNLEYNKSLQQFLQRLLRLPNPLLAKPTVLDLHGIAVIWDINTERQWIKELAALFNKALYWQKILTLAVVQNALDRKNNTPHLWNFAICDKILIVNADFTNINWIGMWITVGLLILVCIISYGISFLEWASQINISPLSREVWQQLDKNASRWVKKWLDRIRDISYQDHPVNLNNLSAQALRPLDEEPDNPI
jgi:hypothetical protein